MEIVYILIASGILILFFVGLWLKERRKAEVEYVAYGLRASEDDEITKTNITEMEASFMEAISKLEELGEVQQDNWGRWIWTKTGQPVGSLNESD